ncbi:5-(carboxyamino)imidazole ribonucleotide synthase [Agriterribacter sp.]|uniref:5-(carboxyamino)imidazole ribonucleotide synthase n=1 Tax=Agriterribacter sp. TaxID=2821509 RepID=UPI002B88C425|nr:5-(carboxyamino)imidazole ribonucleotide synthase [Agriterribacter sp.]HRO47474.1 5-(carboxyamino)imidazole ribonucleotide synthase [Agriterribacter sp.]HRQ18611.1 5-(carboxyamino)imidazole ribonucleotide synthase [Agriterribacter sp.]
MLKVGILGGGQLGRMLLQAAANYPVETYVMENDADCPAAHLCHHFVKGDIRNYNDVYTFGKSVDALTIEIESVNDDALAALEAEGIKIYPRTAALRIIKNKIEQKQFYAAHSIPSADFVITRSLQELERHADFFPAVHKLGSGGYDGRGVQVIASVTEAGKGFDAPAVLEKKINIHKEIAQIVAVNDTGQTTLYPPVDMVFDPELNLLDYQVSPAELAETILWKVEAIALKVVKALASPGIFAVELFIDKVGEVYVNETAPRVHNSGHHTIEGNYSSQFDMLWRIILGYPLGNTAAILPAAIVNVLGEENYSGVAQYNGLEDVLQMDNVFVHIYGKKETKPGRKMGHVTILSADRKDLTYKQRRIRQVLKVVSDK